MLEILLGILIVILCGKIMWWLMKVLGKLACIIISVIGSIIALCIVGPIVAILLFPLALILLVLLAIC